eukprot:TRINITY_DN4477_c0_g2_i5.p1 TRINITY_DN4477_c0_g2~~TRINITY_DN4477_c0_g2_i5.p1  ORF type:complete len:222 (-),score=10.61 TRINITY_DN4477_c0_g2_i5:508-1173(-)
MSILDKIFQQEKMQGKKTEVNTPNSYLIGLYIESTTKLIQMLETSQASKYFIQSQKIDQVETNTSEISEILKQVDNIEKYYQSKIRELQSHVANLEIKIERLQSSTENFEKFSWEKILELQLDTKNSESQYQQKTQEQNSLVEMLRNDVEHKNEELKTQQENLSNFLNEIKLKIENSEQDYLIKSKQFDSRFENLEHKFDQLQQEKPYSIPIRARVRVVTK